MMKGLDILIYINGKVVGAQASAQLNRTTKIVDISNKITLDWDKHTLKVIQQKWNSRKRASLL